MAQFEELQTLWQTQPSPPATPAALAGAFRRYGRRQDIINIAKSVMIVGALINTVVRFHNRPPMLLATIGILSICAVALIAEWRIQRRIARLNFSAASIDFVRATIAHLKAQRNPYHTPAYGLLLGGVFAFYNFLVFAMWPKLTVERRIIFHVLACLFPPVIYIFGRWVRAKRWNADYRPLVERLTVLLENLEDGAR